MDTSFKQLDFANYKTFDDINFVSSNFFQKIITVIDIIAPYRNKRIKGNTEKWFDSKVLEKLNARDKLFKKKSNNKKQAFFKEKLSEMIGKHKELWESVKSLGMPNKTVVSNFNAIEEGNTLTHDTHSIS